MLHLHPAKQAKFLDRLMRKEEEKESSKLEKSKSNVNKILENLSDFKYKDNVKLKTPINKSPEEMKKLFKVKSSLEIPSIKEIKISHPKAKPYKDEPKSHKKYTVWIC